MFLFRKDSTHRIPRKSQMNHCAVTDLPNIVRARLSNVERQRKVDAQVISTLQLLYGRPEQTCCVCRSRVSIHARWVAHLAYHTSTSAKRFLEQEPVAGSWSCTSLVCNADTILCNKANARLCGINHRGTTGWWVHWFDKLGVRMDSISTVRFLLEWQLHCYDEVYRVLQWSGKILASCPTEKVIAHRTISTDNGGFWPPQQSPDGENERDS